VNKYFSKDWKYTVFETEKRSGGEVVSYAKRKINTDDVVESKIFNKYTDYLALKDGKIIYGKILLTDFEETELDAPLIDSTKLNELINIKGYPKEVFADYSVLQSSVLKDVDYLSDEFEELADTLSNCVSSSNSVVYLYKSFSQTYLTPIYKIDMQCTVEYNSQQYSIPAVAYVNAINPEYISIPE
jgi:hypothetical protein